MLHAVIMAGGSGTRFWPQSRKSRPKQLLALAEERTMIQVTAARSGDLIPVENTWVVTNAVQAEETCRQLSGVPASNVLIEPAARNTAPCLAFAAIKLLEADPEATMLVMPADHVIKSVDRFQADVKLAVEQVEANPDKLLLFGVKPDYPAIGFGYIERGADAVAADRIFPVSAFREKPTADVAQQYLDAGNYYWNCGIFVWKARTVLEALAQFEPGMYEGVCELQKALGTESWNDELDRIFPTLKSTSIDYAVLERSQSVQVIEASYDWDDVGSWNALARLMGEDENGNTLVGKTCAVNTNGCIVRSSDSHLIATSDVSDLIIVHTDDVTMVAKKTDENAVRNIVAALKEQGIDEVL